MVTRLKSEDIADLPIESMILQCKTDRYKLAYTAIRWAKEIKQVENLPDPVPVLLPRALREILTGKVEIEAIEKLPMIVKVAPPPPPPTPTITVNAEPEEKAEAPTVKAPAAKSEE